MNAITISVINAMIDRKARDDMANNLANFTSGKISNFEFEDKTPDSDDPVIWAIFDTLWCLYDDFKEHNFEYSEDLYRSNLSRWILFLKSDNEYEWPDISHPGIRPLNHSLLSKILGSVNKERSFMSFGDYDVWPFLNRLDYEKASCKQQASSPDEKNRTPGSINPPS